MSKLDFCEKCILGKSRRLKFNTAKDTTLELLEYVHSDPCGASRAPTLGGARYFMTIINDLSRKVLIY